MSTVQDPRKANVHSLVEDAVPGAKIEAATCLSALAGACQPFFLWHFPLRTLQFLDLHLLFLLGLTFIYFFFGLTFKSLTHFEFIFVYGYNFILLHVAVQFTQHH